MSYNTVAMIVVPDIGTYALKGDIRPARAAVVPRVTTSDGAEHRLDDCVAEFLRAGGNHVVQIIGGTGQGKSTAIQHLAAVFANSPGLRLIDDSRFLPVLSSTRWIIVCTCTTLVADPHVTPLQLAAWTDDDLIEYLLARHRERCTSVMNRILPCEDRALLKGIPELWTPVLDAMAVDDGLLTVEAAVRVAIISRCPSANALPLLGNEVFFKNSEARDRVLGPFLRHRPVQLMLAARQALASLVEDPADFLSRRLPRDLIAQIARQLRTHSNGLVALSNALISDDRKIQPMAASIQFAVNAGWQPDEGTVPSLIGAQLQGAIWPGIRLGGVEMQMVNLAQANLTHADLDGAKAYSATLTGALLERAWLRGALLSAADLAGAKLVKADCSRAIFSKANLERADLSDAILAEADFASANLTSAVLAGAQMHKAQLEFADLNGADLSGADLERAFLRNVDLRNTRCDGASFRRARLLHCNLSGLVLNAPNFVRASLRRSDLGGSTMPKARFRKADLRNTGLANIDWEGADLRDANLRNASFQLGSSRSGLVNSATPSEGSRTGFYTDEYDDKGFKPPEQIRKANLSRANLIGARVEETDFYLVDLRGAKYTSEQRRHFARCGAILE